MIDRSLRTAVNTMAHAEGQRHADEVKRRVMAELEAMQGTGATHAELLAYIATREPGPKEGQGP